MKWNWIHNIDRLDRQAWLLLTVTGLHAFSTSLSSTFVNVFLWKLKKDFALIGWYNFSHFIASLFTFIFVGWLIKQVDRVVAIRLGVICQAVFFLTVLFLGALSVNYVIWLGAFLGIGYGFYWLAYNVMYFEITEKENRDVFNSINGLFVAIAGIIAPVLSGFIITRFRYFLGYRIVFSLSLAIFVVAIVVTFLLKSRSSDGRYQLKEVLGTLKEKGDWFWVSVAAFGQGLREGVFLFVLGILIFLTTKNELALGSYYTACAVISLIANIIVAKFIRFHRRNRFVFIGAIMMWLITFPYIFTLQNWAIIVAGLGICLFLPFYFTPLTSIAYDVIGRSQERAKLRVEYIVSREILMNVGRMISSFSFLLLVSRTQDISYLRWILFLFGASQLLSLITIRKIPLRASSTTPTLIHK